MRIKEFAKINQEGKIKIAVVGFDSKKQTYKVDYFDFGRESKTADRLPILDVHAVKEGEILLTVSKLKRS